MSQPANAAGWRQGRLLSPIVVQRGGRNHLLLQLGLRLVLSGRGVDIDLCSKGGLGRNCSLDLLGSASSIFCGSLVIGHGCFFLTWDVLFFFLYGPMQLKETRLQVVSSQKTLLTPTCSQAFREGKKTTSCIVHSNYTFESRHHPYPIGCCVRFSSHKQSCPKRQGPRDRLFRYWRLPPALPDNFIAVQLVWRSIIKPCSQRSRGHRMYERRPRH